MLNSVNLLGRLVGDPILRHTHTNRIPVASFTVAVNRRMPKDKSREQETDFFNIVAWNATADFVNRHFTKGKLITINGRLQQHIWTDDKDNKRFDVRVVAENVGFAGYNKSESDSGVVGSIGGADYDGNHGPYYDPNFDPYQDYGTYPQAA
jgi:single-strand DNA-binding protein